MSAWILILTLITSDGVQVNTNAEFADQASCERAGKAWENSINNYAWSIRQARPIYDCVSKR